MKGIMKIKHNDPAGDLWVPALNQVVAAGEVVDATEEIAANLVEQGWSAVKDIKKDADK